MKDYKMINEAIAVAEDLLAQEKQHYMKCVCNAEWEIKYQVGEYIYNLLRNARFPHISGFRCFNGCEICFNSSAYLHDGQNFQYQLFIKVSNEVSRIYFNEEGYYEDTMQPMTENTLIALVNNWDRLKRRIPELIDEAYRKHLDEIKKEADEIKRKQEILKSFKL
jgi:hypothetical protein